MSFTLQMLALALGTYLMRVSVIALAADRSIPMRVQSTLRLIPAAVLPALVAEALVFEDTGVRPFGPWYVALALAGAVAAVTRSVGATLLTGIGAVWILDTLW